MVNTILQAKGCQLTPSRKELNLDEYMAARILGAKPLGSLRQLVRTPERIAVAENVVKVSEYFCVDDR